MSTYWLFFWALSCTWLSDWTLMWSMSQVARSVAFRLPHQLPCVRQFDNDLWTLKVRQSTSCLRRRVEPTEAGRLVVVIVVMMQFVLLLTPQEAPHTHLLPSSSLDLMETLCCGAFRQWRRDQTPGQEVKSRSPSRISWRDIDACFRPEITITIMNLSGARPPTICDSAYMMTRRTWSLKQAPHCTWTVKQAFISHQKMIRILFSWWQDCFYGDAAHFNLLTWKIFYCLVNRRELNRHEVEHLEPARPRP